MENIFEFDKLWDYNNPEETERKFRALLPEVKKSGNKSAYLQLLTQIARTLSLQLKFDESDKVLDEIESELDEEQYIAAIRYDLERGRVLNSSKKGDRGRKNFIKAYELGLEKKEDNLAIDAAHMLGIIEPYEEAQKWNETAMKLAEESKVEKAKGWLGALYNNTAWNYHDNKEYEKALKLFEKNVELHTQKKSGFPLIIAKWSVARTLRSLDKIDEAIKMHFDLLKEIEEKGLQQDGYIYEELGENFLIQNKKEESRKNFALAYEILSKDRWLAEYEKERLERIKELSK